MSKEERPYFIMFLDEISYPTGSALHFNLKKKLGDYMKVLYENPRRFYEGFISITSRGSHPHHFFITI